MGNLYKIKYLSLTKTLKIIVKNAKSPPFPSNYSFIAGYDEPLAQMD
jgi:hypothetical protein